VARIAPASVVVAKSGFAVSHVAGGFGGPAAPRRGALFGISPKHPWPTAAGAAQSPTDYNVVMVTPVSIRFRRAEVLTHLKAEAEARRVSSSALAEELIEEGLRSRRHPLVIFRDGATGRRATLVGGPDIWEVIGGIVGGDVPAHTRIERAAEQFGLSPQQVGAALDYYAAFTSEIDNEIATNLAAADEAEAAWRRRQDLLAG
jgi:hypothetical protein